MERTPKVSVIIPVYNVEDYLCKCLDSLINQTLKSIEIICVDDGSTDRSLEVLKKYAIKDERVFVIQQKNNHAGVARNRGLEIARGEYVIFLDSDDYFEEELLWDAYSSAIETKADVVLFDAQKFDSQTGEHNTEYHYLKQQFLPQERVFSYKTFRIKFCRFRHLLRGISYLRGALSFAMDCSFRA